MKISAVGMNCAQHNKELGILRRIGNLLSSWNPTRLFLKDGSCLFPTLHEVHYETVVVRICRLGKNHSCLRIVIMMRWLAGIDFTARDLQRNRWPVTRGAVQRFDNLQPRERSCFGTTVRLGELRFIPMWTVVKYNAFNDGTDIAFKIDEPSVSRLWLWTLPGFAVYRYLCWRVCQSAGRFSRRPRRPTIPPQPRFVFRYVIPH